MPKTLIVAHMKFGGELEHTMDNDTELSIEELVSSMGERVPEGAVTVVLGRFIIPLASLNYLEFREIADTEEVRF